MPYYYTDASRESNPHALPDVEIFSDDVWLVDCQRDACRETSEVPHSELQATAPEAYCRCCEYHTSTARRGSDSPQFWYQFGSPGYMPSSDWAEGPYETEAEALAAAREAAGCCPHGVPDDGDTICEECPAPELWVLEFAPLWYACAQPSGRTSDPCRAMAWSSKEAAETSRDRMAFCDGSCAVRLTDDEARRWGRSE